MSRESHATQYINRRFGDMSFSGSRRHC